MEQTKIIEKDKKPTELEMAKLCNDIQVLFPQYEIDCFWWEQKEGWALTALDRRRIEVNSVFMRD